VAAKAAENIARLAALFHLLDHGAASTIDRMCVDSAAQIVGWHLQEAHRLLGDLDAPPVMAAAIRFDALLAEHGRARIEADGRRRFVDVNPAPYGD
jgi:putative DNA primase/helicase